MHIVNISWTHLERSRVQHAGCARSLFVQETSAYAPSSVGCKKNMPARLPVYDEAYRLFGVDLSAVSGVSGGVFCVLMSELGTANDVREKFRSAEAFASWLGLCPDNRISGGRILKTGTRKVANRVANILRLALHNNFNVLLLRRCNDQ